MSFGIGALHTKSTKQKLNTKSSTEAELVGVSEYLPYHIWLINFLEHQGYKVKEKLLFQDNESTIRMEVNGRNSCTGNSRHVDIRFFFVHDRVKSGKSMSCIVQLVRWWRISLRSLYKVASSRSLGLR